VVADGCPSASLAVGRNLEMSNQSHHCDPKIDLMRLLLLHGHHMGAGIASDGVEFGVAVSLRLDLWVTNSTHPTFESKSSCVLLLSQRNTHREFRFHDLVFAVIHHKAVPNMKGTAVRLRFEVGLGGVHSHCNGVPANLPYLQRSHLVSKPSAPASSKAFNSHMRTIITLG
jgi:hypothetical protein